MAFRFARATYAGAFVLLAWVIATDDRPKRNRNTDG